MSDDRKLQLKAQILCEAIDELESLHGPELDKYLLEIGLSPDDLVQEYSRSLANAVSTLKRVRFEEARRHARSSSMNTNRSNIVSLDLARKRAIMASIKELAAKTGTMTIAARNQKIDSEKDLDSFLEACVALDLLDEEGNLKE